MVHEYKRKLNGDGHIRPKSSSSINKGGSLLAVQSLEGKQYVKVAENSERERKVTIGVDCEGISRSKPLSLIQVITNRFIWRHSFTNNLL